MRRFTILTVKTKITGFKLVFHFWDRKNPLLIKFSQILAHKEFRKFRMFIEIQNWCIFEILKKLGIIQLSIPFNCVSRLRIRIFNYYFFNLNTQEIFRKNYQTKISFYRALLYHVFLVIGCSQLLMKFWAKWVGAFWVFSRHLKISSLNNALLENQNFLEKYLWPNF